jgi:hypothetical protein
LLIEEYGDESMRPRARALERLWVFQVFCAGTEMSKAGVRDREAGPFVALPDRHRVRMYQRMTRSPAAGEGGVPISVISGRPAQPLIPVEHHGRDRNGP